MLKEAVGTAATVEEAKARALMELGLSADADFKIEVLETPAKKMFGLLGTTPAKVKVSYEVSPYAGVQGYLETMLAALGIENTQMDFEETDEEIRISVECSGDYGAAIGRRGETLDAIQYLARLAFNRGAQQSKRVCVNIGNYRQKREATLRSLAARSAEKVKKYGRNVVLDPMNPYERRVIHTTVQEIEGVTSHSVGSESNRKVVITLEEGVRPQNAGKKPGKGGYQNRDRDYNKNRGYKKDSAPAARSSSPSRPPRSDAASASRYGRIEPGKTQD